MPPKRKASAAQDEPTRVPVPRRTRVTNAVGDTAEQAEAELPPPKRTRRRANAKDEPATAQNASRGLTDVSAAVAGTSRATRAGARSRKAEGSTAMDAAQKQSAPKTRGKNIKIQPEVEVEQDPRAKPPMPPSPVQEEQNIVPRKRGRPKKIQEAAELVPENHRPKRTTRRAKDPVDTVSEDTSVRAVALSSVNDKPSAYPDASSSPPKKRGRRQVVAPAKKAVALSRLPPVGVQNHVSHQLEADEISDDELLLKPLVGSSSRPATPTRNGENRVGTPRMFMHSVEITTTKNIIDAITRGSVSPGPRLTEAAYNPPSGTPRLPAAFSTSASPGKRNLVATLLPSSRQRAVRTPSPQPRGHRLSSLYPQPPESPSRTTRRSQHQETQASQPSEDLPRVVPANLLPLLERQKRAILNSLQQLPKIDVDEIDIYGEDYPPTNTLALEQLGDLLTGTVVRGEGNSCLLIGPSGSGKTQTVERAIATLPTAPIVIRLSGFAQHNDRLAIREIAWQLALQTGQSFLPSESDDAEDGEEPPPDAPRAEQDDGDDNPFVEPRTAPALDNGVVALPPPAHLLALISMIPTLPRPTIIVLDGFDLFAGHARQALLYCLLDTAQACRAGTGAGSGMAVVGVTSRVDTINLLEKRVKSRFSGRMIRTACPAKIEHWVALAREALGASVVDVGAREDADEKAWESVWGRAVKKFVEDEAVVDALRETYALTRDFQMFRRIMTCLALELKPTSPYPTVGKLKLAVSRQRCPPRYPALHTLPYPAICLLIASVHAQTTGHDVFTFEMLYEAFKNQVRTSQSAPVQVEGSSIGMVRCSREVLFSAFERLADVRVFLPAAAAAASISKEFALHRSAVDRFAVKKAVETIGQLSLKKWFRG